jgi:hypothetical protein
MFPLKQYVWSKGLTQPNASKRTTVRDARLDPYVDEVVGGSTPFKKEMIFIKCAQQWRAIPLSRVPFCTRLYIVLLFSSKIVVVCLEGLVIVAVVVSVDMMSTKVSHGLN